jgi:hypothetical protein
MNRNEIWRDSRASFCSKLNSDKNTDFKWISQGILKDHAALHDIDKFMLDL